MGLKTKCRPISRWHVNDAVNAVVCYGIIDIIILAYLVGCQRQSIDCSKTISLNVRSIYH